MKIAIRGTSPAVSLRIVDEYVHLGGTRSSDGHPNADVQKRVSSAMLAYGPIANPILGSSRFA
eukprot:3914055-Karenia_brevis.AAC.1